MIIMMTMLMLNLMMPIHILLNISNLYADARSMTPSRNTRCYILRSVPSSPGRSFLNMLKKLSNDLCSENGFRDFEELSGYSHHRCKVLVIPGVDYQGQDDDSFFLW